MDSDIILCGVAGDVQEREKELGKIFEGEELERSVQLTIMKTSIDTLDAVSKVGK